VADVVHAFVLRVEREKIDLERFERLSLKFDAGLDICSCERFMRRLGNIAEMWQLENQIPAPAITPFKALSITKTMVIKANIFDYRWNAAILEDVFAFKRLTSAENCSG
jgi:hypothetical protein